MDIGGGAGGLASVQQSLYAPRKGTEPRKGTDAAWGEATASAGAGQG